MHLAQKLSELEYELRSIWPWRLWPLITYLQHTLFHTLVVSFALFILLSFLTKKKKNTQFCLRWLCIAKTPTFSDSLAARNAEVTQFLTIIFKQKLPGEASGKVLKISDGRHAFLGLLSLLSLHSTFTWAWRCNSHVVTRWGSNMKMKTHEGWRSRKNRPETR